MDKRNSKDRIDLPSKKYNLTCTVVTQSIPRLIQVEYPGLVENPDRAVRTLGGINRISETFTTPKKRLEIKFRPADIYCKPAYGDSSATCGLLIKLRRKKSHIEVSEPEPMSTEQPLIDLTGLPSPPARPSSPEELEVTLPPSTSYQVVENTENQRCLLFSGPFPDDLRSLAGRSMTKQVDPPECNEFMTMSSGILDEEQKFLEDLTQKKRIERVVDEGSFLGRESGRTNQRSRIYVKVPEDLSEIRAPRSHFHIEVLGLVPRAYKFNGMCDFQYLPMKRVKKRYVSIANKIIPVFPNPDLANITVKDLIVCDMAREGHGKDIPEFLVPAIMSRVDKPIVDLVNFLEGSINKDRMQKQRSILRSTRTKRVIYSNLCNFRVTDNQLSSSRCLVPEHPLSEALVDAGKRGLIDEQLTNLKQLFEQRPIWTRLAIEHATNVGLFALKYILPCVAYFALNGPWRSCWIRFGYDPRRDKTAYIYQLLDYRVTMSYRGLMPNKKKAPLHATDVNKEALFAFKPGMIPPKRQMIYQICEIHLKEIEELNQILQSRLARNEEMPFNSKYGFLTEDVIEYCRYCISRNVELFLKSTGRIHNMTLPEVPLPPDGVIPKEILLKSAITRNPSAPFRGIQAKRKARSRLRLSALDEGDDASNQSSNLGDLTITDELPEHEDIEEIDIEGDDSEEEEHDDDERIMNEALEATAGRIETEYEENEEMDIDESVDHILGLASE